MSEAERNHTAGSQGPLTRVWRWLTGAAALHEALNAVRAERDRVREAGRLIMDDAYRSKTMYEAERDALLGIQEQLRELRFAQLSGHISISEFFARFEKVVDGMTASSSKAGPS